MGLIAALSLQLVYAALQLAGTQISFVMGFTMASVMDPQTGVSTPLVSQFLGLLAVMMILAFDGHHLMILFFSKSLGSLQLGTFYPEPSLWSYLSKGVRDMFILGFVLSFPIKAFSLMSDIIFGMLMKTMPQFNLLVVGFPIKIFISFAVIIVTLSAILMIYKREFLEVMKYILMWF
jgi:flagellar biosynthetic protein FliR